MGDAAKNQLTNNPENTAYEAKRLVGREFTDKTMPANIKFFPFKLVDKNSNPFLAREFKQVPDCHKDTGSEPVLPHHR